MFEIVTKDIFDVHTIFRAALHSSFAPEKRMVLRQRFYIKRSVSKVLFYFFMYDQKWLALKAKLFISRKLYFTLLHCLLRDIFSTSIKTPEVKSRLLNNTDLDFRNAVEYNAERLSPRTVSK